jgi:hypothetical protein
MQLNWFMGRRASTVLKVATSSRSAPVFTLRAIAVDWRRTSLPIGFDRDRRRCTCCPHQTKRQKHDPLGMDDKLYSYLRRQWCNALRWMGPSNTMFTEYDQSNRNCEWWTWVPDVVGTVLFLDSEPAHTASKRSAGPDWCCMVLLPIWIALRCLKFQHPLETRTNLLDETTRGILQISRIYLYIGDIHRHGNFSLNLVGDKMR